MLKYFSKEYSVPTLADKTTYINIKDSVQEAIQESNIQNGVVYIITAHTTCSVFYEEFCHDIAANGDEFLQIDLNNVLRKIIPDHVNADTYNYPGEEHYKEVESWPDYLSYLPNGDRSALWNGDAHLKSTLIDESVTLNVVNNALHVGSTGYIYFADFDTTRERTRKYTVSIIGE